MAEAGIYKRAQTEQCSSELYKHSFENMIDNANRIPKNIDLEDGL
jgi:hypothetical protein